MGFLGLEVEVEKWNDLLRIQDVFSGTFVFRGHSKSDWKLSSSMERAVSELNKIDWFLLNRESYIIEQFRRNSELYFGSNFSEKSDLEVMTIMQHYGTPTRLVDVSKSFLVGLFFCTDDFEDVEASLWIFNSDIPSQKVHYLNHGEYANELLISQYYKENFRFAESLLKDEKKVDFVIPCESFFINEREAQQKGLEPIRE